MEISLALLDVDGTLRHKDRWNPGAVELIRELRARGIRVALCSGRPTGSLQAISRDLPEIEFLASCSGTTVLEREGDGWRQILHRDLPDGAVAHAVAAAEANGDEIWAYTDTEWLVQEGSPMVEREQSFVDDAPRVARLVDEPGIGKILFQFDSPEHAEALRRMVRIPGTKLVQSGPRYMDLIPDDAFVMKGGDGILAATGVAWTNVMAMGDSENDIGMLSHAALAVTVEGLTPDRLPAPEPWQRRLDATDTQAAREQVLALLGDC